MLKKMSVKAGLIALLVVMMLIQLLVSVIGGQAISKGATSLQQINRLQNQELGSLSDSYIYSLRARTASAVAVHELEIGMLDDSEKTCERIQNYLKKSSQELAIFTAIDDGDSEGRVLTKAVTDSYKVYRTEALEPALAAIKAQSTDIYYDILEKKMDRYSNAYDKALEQFRQYAEKRAQHSTDAAEHASHMQLTIIFTAYLVSLIITILSWFALRKIIISPLDESISQLEFIAAGDLTHEIDDSGNNEMGRLAKALNKMQNSLSLSMVQVREAAQWLGDHELEGYELYNLGHYPAVIPGDGKVYCEVYRINSSIMAELDELKSNTKDYKRELISTPYGSAWIYLYIRSLDGVERIIGGDWVKRDDDTQ